MPMGQSAYVLIGSHYLPVADKYLLVIIFTSKFGVEMDTFISRSRLSLARPASGL